MKALLVIAGAWSLLFAYGVSCSLRAALRDSRERRQMEALRRLGDHQFEAKEVALWRIGIDPCGPVELGSPSVVELEQWLNAPSAAEWKPIA